MSDEPGVRELLSSLAQIDGLMVAFSGGADSAFLLAAAVRALGADRVVAATAVSSSLPASELDAAQVFASGLGVRHELAPTAEMARPGYRANAGDRCYFCKAELLDTLRPLAERLGIEHIATGTNADDALAGF
ncbi:MAG: TIGR00268 family protein, partial [Mycobacteriales bacterium]